MDDQSALRTSILADMAGGRFSVHSSVAAVAARFCPALLLAAFALACAAGPGRAADCLSPQTPVFADFTARLRETPDPADLAEARRTIERRFGVRFAEDSVRLVAAPTSANPRSIRIEATVCGKPEALSDIRASAWMIRMATGADVEIANPLMAERRPAGPPALPAADEPESVAQFQAPRLR